MNGEADGKELLFKKKNLFPPQEWDMDSCVYTF